MNKSDYATVKSQLSMTVLLEYYLGAEGLAAYTQKGNQLRGSCVLCDTKKRSTLSINTSKNCFQSFCCYKKGNILDFVAAKEGVQISEAVTLLIDWFSLDTQASGHFGSQETRPQNGNNSTLSASIESVEYNQPLSFELKNIDPNHERVQALDISEKTAAYFGVGYYQGRGMFKNHVVFPIHNLDGELIGYAGMDDERQFHYPEKFRHDLSLYNAHRVRKSLEQYSDPVVIANSPYDTVRLYDADIRHGVATMSGAMSPQQLEIMSFVANVSSCGLKPKGVQDAQAAYALSDDEILERGAGILASRMKDGDVFNCPEQVKEFLKRKLSHLEREVFMCLYLDNKNRLIAFEDLFSGTVNQVSVYPREVAKQALKHNASAVIIGHNHPSGEPEPSTSDRSITVRIKDSLAVLDIRFLDHIIVGGNNTCSLAERGEI